MKNKLTVLSVAASTVVLIFLALPIFTFAQTTNPTPAPTPSRTPNMDNIRVNQEYNRMRTLRESQAAREELRIRERKLALAKRTLNELYRNPTNKELLTLKVDEDLTSQYSSFLKQDNAGIVKLLNNSNCSQSSKVVVATNDCLNYTMPGAGASFSFRTNNYRIAHLSDLNFTGNYFVSAGIWSHGILVNIGNFPLETFSFQNKEVEYINTINPGVKYENVKDFYTILAKGISNGNFIYSNSARVQKDSTYLLRSIAYRGTINKTVEGFVYNELDYDKRKDVLVVFRVIRQHSDGSITILWKKLASKESPKIFNKEVKIDPTGGRSNFAAKTSISIRSN